MRSLELALLGDFWRRGKWGFALTFLGMTSLLLLVYGSLRYQGWSEPNSVEAVNMHVVFALVLGFCAVTAAFVAQGNIARFYPRPISATRLVACQLSAGLVAAAVLYVLAAGFLNFVMGTSWPLFGPALFFAAALACVQAAVWWGGSSIAAQFVACTATTIPLAIWFARRYGATTFGDWRIMWDTPTALETLTIALVTLGAYMAAILAVSRNRRGEGVDLGALARWFESWFAARRLPERFRTPAAAQFWFEWRQKHGPVPAEIMGLGMLVCLGLRLTGLIEADDAFGLLFALPLTLVAFVMPIVYGIVVGNCGNSSTLYGAGHFFATRPLTNSGLAGAMLRNGALAIFAAWSVWVVGFLVILGIFARLGDVAFEADAFRFSQLGYWNVPLIAAAALVMSWSLMGIVVAVAATGRLKLTLVVVCGLWIAALAFGCAAKYALPEYRERVDQSGLALTGLGIIGIALWASALAMRKRLVPERTLWLVAFSWFAFVALGVAACLWTSSALGIYLHVAGLSALPGLPFVSVPLALSLNRHRT